MPFSLRSPLVLIGTTIVVGTSLFLWTERTLKETSREPLSPTVASEESGAVLTVIAEGEGEESAAPPEEKIPIEVSPLIAGVPFTVQAPNGEWDDPLFQDGCEEAALIMAAAWVNGTILTKAGVKKEIQDLSVFEVKQFGQAVDTSLIDTQFLLSTYFGITTSELRIGVGIDDIKRAVADGKIVIVPADGRKLKNPHFKQPGPARHMLVIVGYDTKMKEFIVNDPGTRYGEGYRYPEEVLFGALLDYPTGDHSPVMSTDKVMLIVSQN